MYSEISQLDLYDETIRIQNFSRKLCWKNCWKIPKLLRCREAHSILNYQRYRSQILIAEIKDLNGECVKFWCPYILYFYRNKPSKSVKVRSDRAGLGLPGRFIVLNNSAIPKMVLKLYSNCFRFLNVVEATHM